MARHRISVRALPPVHRPTAGYAAPASAATAREVGPALPPPAQWPRDLKRLVHAFVTRGGRTWEQWNRTWKPPAEPTTEPPAEPIWFALRTLAWLLRPGFRAISNEDAWSICIVEARRLRAGDCRP